MKPKLDIAFCCVGTKWGEVDVKQMYDCVVSPEEWKANNEALPHKVKALNLYAGPGWDIVKRIIEKLQTHYDVTPWIFSAGWGILRWDDMINPYSATFSSSSEDRIFAADQRDWILGVTQHRLPKGTVCVFPESYAKPYRRIFDDLEDMILIQGTPDDREDLGCSMIRTSVLLTEKIVDNQIEENWDLEPTDWSQLRGYEVL